MSEMKVTLLREVERFWFIIRKMYYVTLESNYHNVRHLGGFTYGNKIVLDITVQWNISVIRLTISGYLWICLKDTETEQERAVVL